MSRVRLANRLLPVGNTLSYVRYLDDFPAFPSNNLWDDTVTSGFGDSKIYVVQTNTKVVERCLLMTTDPGDLVLDPTCGSGTTAYVAEQWGRRWITIDTSRVALALARTRLMAARFPYYILADSPEGLRKEAEIAGRPQPERTTASDIRRGFVHGRLAHITLKSIANNAEIDVIHERWQRTLEPLRAEINKLLDTKWEEWELPRALNPALSRPKGEGDAKRADDLLAQWWEARQKRQQEIDASITRNAETEYLYDRPYEDKSVVRVTGPFTEPIATPGATDRRRGRGAARCARSGGARARRGSAATAAAHAGARGRRRRFRARRAGKPEGRRRAEHPEERASDVHGDQALGRR
jgi:adenine-specific DNA-methyltransferase